MLQNEVQEISAFKHICEKIIWKWVDCRKKIYHPPLLFAPTLLPPPVFLRKNGDPPSLTLPGVGGGGPKTPLLEKTKYLEK